MEKGAIVGCQAVQRTVNRWFEEVQVADDWESGGTRWKVSSFAPLVQEEEDERKGGKCYC